MESNSYRVNDLASLKQLALRLLAELPKQNTATVLALSGDLGAGKTTFVQYLGQGLGVSEVITSPTFTIMKGYELPGSVSKFERLIHMDAYRIDDFNELVPLHFNELLSLPNTLFCIEWAEKIEVALPKNRVHIKIKQLNEVERVVEVESSL